MERQTAPVQAAVAAEAPARQPTQRVIRPAAIDVVQEAKPAAPQQNLAAVTIVDIAADGSFVLITDPTTRLPTVVTAGQKIHTGETITAIDASSGTVKTDQRKLQVK